MSRLFTFGCSFTNFFWPTWADILGREFDEFENWGQNGAGNCFMLHSLTECNQRNRLGPEDTIIIMWSGVDRQDRWVRGSWRLEGGVYNGQPEFTQQYLDNFADPTGFLIRDLSIISAARHMLNNIGCTWYFLSMVPLDYIADLGSFNDVTDAAVLELYADELALIRPSVYEVIFNKNWYSRPGYCNLAHYKQSYENQAGPDWPSTKNFITKNFNGTAKHIMHEINQRLQLSKRLIRTDTHPTPSEHLEYLEKVLPEFQIQYKTKQWVAKVDKSVLELNSMYAPDSSGSWLSSLPKDRF